MKKIALLSLFILLFTACETGIKCDENGSNCTIPPTLNSGIVDLIDEKPLVDNGFETDLHPIIMDGEKSNYKSSINVQRFEGGTISDGLNLKAIREGSHNEYRRLVFDTYMWSNGQSQPAKSVGHYVVNYVPENRLITVVIEGYRAFSASFPTFSNSNIVEKIYLDNYLDDSAYKFHIQLRDRAKVRVFDLKEPARLVFDIKKI